MARRAHGLDRVDRPAEPLRRLLGVGFAPELRRQLVELVDPLVDVDRHADRAALLGDSLADRLPDPDRRVGREPVAGTRVELLDRPHQPQRPLLDKVGQREWAVIAHIALGDMDHQPQVGLDHAVLGGKVAAFTAVRERPLLCRGQ